MKKGATYFLYVLPAQRANAWERMTFKLLDRPDGSASGAKP
jgi:hypothetical protein